MKNGVFLTLYIIGTEDCGFASCMTSSVFGFLLGLGGSQLPESTNCTGPVDSQILLSDSVTVALITPLVQKKFSVNHFSARFNSLITTVARSQKKNPARSRSAAFSLTTARSCFQCRVYYRVATK